MIVPPLGLDSDRPGITVSLGCLAGIEQRSGGREPLACQKQLCVVGAEVVADLVGECEDP